MKEVMVDIETLGTVASAVIMSIGAVRFDLQTRQLEDKGFYASISIDSNLAAGRQISEDTLLWWLGQPEAAKKVFIEPKETLESALSNFADWYGTGREAAKQNIWSNGADFDLPMMRHAYHLLDMEAPWAPYSGRCVRTYKNLPGADRVPKPSAGVKHNALTDAINQAQHVCAIHEALFGAKVKA